MVLGSKTSDGGGETSRMVFVSEGGPNIEFDGIGNVLGS